MYDYSYIKMVKIQNMTIANAGQDAEQQAAAFIACGNANDITTLEESQTVPYKAK